MVIVARFASSILAFILAHFYNRSPMHYKALLLDLDGTTIPNNRTGVPSQRVIAAIAKASKKIAVGVATGRPLFAAQHILSVLSLSSPCVVNGGAQLYDPRTDLVLWEQNLEANAIKELYTICVSLGVVFLLNDGKQNYTMETPTPSFKVLSGTIPDLDPQIADQLLKMTSHIPTITLHKVPSWNKGHIDVTINHVNATKLHGVHEIARRLKIEPTEIIGVGDSYNDFPLLMACGLKVAMGNAIPDLKAIADYIAPSVEEDGVADVIEKFILNEP